MTFASTFRVLLARWYITIPGLLLSLALAGLTFLAVPPQYSSNAVAVLVQPKLHGKDPTTNPFLTFDSSLSTTALIIVQALDTPETAASIGLSPGGDSYTVKDVGTIDVGDQVVQPFIYIKSQASTEQAAVDIVNNVLDLASQDLLGRQKDNKVLPQNLIKLNDVVGTSPPKPVLGIALAAAGGALLLVLLATTLLAFRADKAAAKRRAQAASDAIAAAPDALTPDALTPDAVTAAAVTAAARTPDAAAVAAAAVASAAVTSDAVTAAAVAPRVEQEAAVSPRVEQEAAEKPEEEVPQKVAAAARPKSTATRRPPKGRSDSTVRAGDSFPSAKAPLAKSGTNGSGRP
ncbi:hypothetical protein ACTXG6_37915 [Pseudonocardia sp. Cha107L01]|jgi:hypothetical protein|uniref:hypothetical protein n=1 Tax=Pseudonocardia sp. Cha107L01 TaxID=3457576 RepID=UPI00403ED16B